MAEHVHVAHHHGDARTDWPDVLRGLRLRITTPRLQVLHALEQLGHATPEEILARAGDGVSGLHLSTVYRTLETLSGAGIVSHAHLGDGPANYALAGSATHAHLVCRECGAIVALEEEVAARFAAGTAAAHGFVVDVGHLAVFGRCAECGPVD